MLCNHRHFRLRNDATDTEVRRQDATAPETEVVDNQEMVIEGGHMPVVAERPTHEPVPERGRERLERVVGVVFGLHSEWFG